MKHPRISDDVLNALIEAKTTADVGNVCARLPIVDPEDYYLGYDGAHGRWRDGHLHWIPVGRDRGNGGRIKLAGEPTNPIAERLINGMEAIIELERRRELVTKPGTPMPTSPRDAALRYFALPRLDSIPRMTDATKKRSLEGVIQELRKKLSVHLAHHRKRKEFAVVIRDAGLGQTPERLHDTLLSLGHTDKADKPYLIGVFGQGGSSAFAASEVSIVLSRRAPDAHQSEEDAGLGWSIVRRFTTKGVRGDYFAYLASTPEGHAPRFDASVADDSGFPHGSLFAHIHYDFGKSRAAVARMLYQALNHVLFNPILPYDLFALKEQPDLMQGTAQRLARQAVLQSKAGALDKSFEAQPVETPAVRADS